MSRWRARASVGEGAANLWRGSVLFAAVTVIFTATITAATMADITTVSRLVAAERDYLDRGGDLLVVTSGDGVDAGRCAALSGVGGVKAAAAASVLVGPLPLTGRPASQQTVTVATAGIQEILHLPVLAAGDVVAGSLIADRWSLATGSHLQLEEAGAVAAGLPSTVLTVAATSDLAVLGEAESTSILLLGAPVGTADRCLLRIDPPYRETVRALVPAMLSETIDNPVQISDRISLGGFAQDPAAAFDDRVTRYGGAAAGLLVGLLWAVIAWTRRGRSALYAALGVPYPGGVLIRWTESTAVVALAALWAVALAVTLSAAQGTGLDLALTLALRHGALAAAVALTTTALCGLWRPGTLAALKDR